MIYTSISLLVTMPLFNCTAMYSLVSNNDNQFTYRDTILTHLTSPANPFSGTIEVQDFVSTIIDPATSNIYKLTGLLFDSKSKESRKSTTHEYCSFVKGLEVGYPLHYKTNQNNST